MTRPGHEPDHLPPRLWWLLAALTVVWGLVIIGFATSASLFDNLIQAVNILGSIFYGTILGLFVVAFFVPRVRATAALIGGVAGQATVTALFFSSDLGFLWFNLIGCAVVVLVALAAEILEPLWK